MKLLVPVVAAAFAFCAFDAGAQEACLNDYQKKVSEIQAAQDPELTATAAEIKRLQDAGFDPEKYIVDFEGKLVPIVVKFYYLAERKSQAIEGANQVAENCAKEVAPYRAIADLLIIYETMGLSLLLPDEMTRIDFAEVLKNGKPFGGDDAVLPKAREVVLDNLGVGGDVRKVIEDPKQILPWNW